MPYEVRRWRLCRLLHLSEADWDATTAEFTDTMLMLEHIANDEDDGPDEDELDADLDDPH